MCHGNYHTRLNAAKVTEASAVIELCVMLPIGPRQSWVVPTVRFLPLAGFMCLGLRTTITLAFGPWSMTTITARRQSQRPSLCDLARRHCPPVIMCVMPPPQILYGMTCHVFLSLLRIQQQSGCLGCYPIQFLESAQAEAMASTMTADSLAQATIKVLPLNLPGSSGSPVLRLDESIHHADGTPKL